MRWPNVPDTEFGRSISGARWGVGCEFGGQKWIFLDVSLGPVDQLEQVLDALRHDPDVVGMPMSGELQNRIGVRKSA